MKISIISSSLSESSRSRHLAKLCHDEIASNSVPSELIDLKEFDPPNFDDSLIYTSHTYKTLHEKVSGSDGLVFCSPVYNWGCCAELKKFIEYVGSTPLDGSLKGAFYDKVITFVNAAGLPHSYMAFTSIANSMMLDFKCIINPYNVYVHNRHWNEDGSLVDETRNRIKKSMVVACELSTLLSKRTYESSWEI